MQNEDVILKISNLNKFFNVDGKKIEVLRNINLEIERGEFITIVGHSGCGKSTLLKIISGLLPYDEGEVIRNGNEVHGPSTDCGMVFQEHRLLPWLKIKDNIGIGIRKLPKPERTKLIDSQLKLVRLEDFKNAYPRQLSGGMSQRAAIARGLVSNPDILLLDEPFGALDAMTRVKMQSEIRRIWKEKKTTMIMVTHDLDEALLLGQRVIVLSSNPGEIRDVLNLKGSGITGRSSENFAFYKKKIYKYFFEGEDNSDFEEDYVI